MKPRRPSPSPSGPSESPPPPVPGKTTKLLLGQKKTAPFLPAILDALPVRVALLETDGSIVTMNVAWHAITEKQFFSAAAGDNFLKILQKIMGPDAPVCRGLEDVLANRIQSFSMESRFEADSSSSRWFLLSANSISEAGLQGTVVMFQDTSELHETEKALRDSQYRFDLAVTGIQDGLWDWDLPTDNAYFSPVWAAMLGYTPEEIVPSFSAWTNLIHPDDLPVTIHDIHMHLQGKTPLFKNVHRLKNKDGKWTYVEARGKCLRDSSGKGIRMTGTITDITERRRVEAQILEQAALLDNARDAILVTDLDDQILFWNLSAARIYGWSEAEALESNAKKLFYRNPSAFLKAKTIVMEDGFWSGELTQSTKDGTEIVSEVRLTLVRDIDDHPKSILSINTDMTEKKRLEAQFLRAQRMESIGTLAGGIAHDLNNVLAPILMSVELLKMTNHTPSSIEVLKTIESSAQRGAEMVKQVLHFARGMEGRKQTIKPGQLIQDTQKLMRETLSKAIDVQVHVSGEVWPLLGDPTQLHQVLLNLCVNARDAMPNGGKLTISAENITLDENYSVMNLEARPGPYVIFQIADTGTGISPEIRGKIFDPFFTTKALGKGTGLGLSTVLAIVKSHEGFVDLISEPGKGTVFKIYLPAHPTLPATGSQIVPSELPRGNGELVLIVDDEASVRTITEHTLLAFGYSVITAGDGAEAVALFAQHRKEVKVIITDMMMPIMEGTAAIHAFLRLEPRTPIIAASGLASNNQMAKAAAAGVRHFLPKPFTAEYLLKLISSILKEAAGNNPSTPVVAQPKPA